MARSESADLGFVPRGLSREEAARWIGVSVTMFDLMVADHRMPAPKEIGRRRVWDRHAIDMAFYALPGGDPLEPVGNTWDS